MTLMGFPSTYPLGPNFAKYSILPLSCYAPLKGRVIPFAYELELSAASNMSLGCRYPLDGMPYILAYTRMLYHWEVVGHVL